MLFAAILGYFMIYGRISDIYLSVITLVVTLIFEKGIRATSGDRFVIGSVRLNGQNGIPTVPSLQVPWSGQELGTDGVFRLAVIHAQTGDFGKARSLESGTDDHRLADAHQTYRYAGGFAGSRVAQINAHINGCGPKPELMLRQIAGADDAVRV